MYHRLSGILTTVFVSSIAAAAHAQDIPIHSHDWGMGWGMGWGMMFVGPLMMALFIAGTVVLVVVALRWLGGGRHDGMHRHGRTPLDILKARFARGEIDKQEFDERRRTLEQ